MNVLFTQISGLTGLFVFLNQMWRYAPLDKSMFVAIATGLGVYVVLMLGDLSVRLILHHYPAKEKRNERDAQTAENVREVSGAASQAEFRPLSA